MSKQVASLLLVTGCTLGLVWTMFAPPDHPADTATASTSGESMRPVTAPGYGSGEHRQAPDHLSVAVADNAPSWAEKVTLPRAPDGHFYADVLVDGMATRMLVDTGATIIALTGGDAAAIGLSWDQADISIVAQGANGPVYGVRTRLPDVEIGGFRASDVPAIIVPDGLEISLLGQAFLASVERVEISADQMILSN